MVQRTEEQLPQVQLYTLGPEKVDLAAPLLTTEAQTYIKAGDAFGLALAEEGELRAAVCARLQPENEAILELISLYVTPQFRRRALGGTLLLELLEETMEATDAGLRVVTAAFTRGTQGIEDLLSRMGFRIEEDETAISWRLTVKELSSSPLLEHTVELPAGHTLYDLQELSNYQIRQLVQTLQQHGVDDLSAQELREAHPHASHVLYNRDNEPIACAIFSEQGDGRIALTQFFTAGIGSAPPLSVLQAGAKVLMEHFPGDTLIDIPTLTDSSAKLVKRLIPASQKFPLMRATLLL